MAVVGAGPSVTLRAEALRKRRDNVCVVSTLSAVGSLAAEGIVPDYCVALDSSPALYNQFAGLEDRLLVTPLIYFPTVHPSVLKAWSGPRFAAYSKTDTTFTPLEGHAAARELILIAQYPSVPRRLRSNWGPSEFFFLA